jgi:diadenosine tetraphosphate (Ap4A) HIT family hydrolase
MIFRQTPRLMSWPPSCGRSAGFARAEGVALTGYRILANHGAAAHQDVPHFHLHLFGGRDLGPMLRRTR